MAHITIPQLAKMLGLNRVTVYRKVLAGEIPAVKVGHTYIIDDSEISELLNKELGENDKKQIEEAVNKTVKEYGEVLKRLGKE